MPSDSTIPYGLCHCGCGEPTRIAEHTDRWAGQERGRPLRYIPGHQRRKSPVEYVVEPTTGCWLWQRATNHLGYGQVRRKGKIIMAHRWIYEREVGPIPDDLSLDHLCRTPGCVNPAHLEPVTHRENLARGQWPTHYNTLKTHCPQGHEYTPDNLRADKRGERLCKTCHRERERQRRLRES